ncbi:hypothetical protein M3D48_04135 [Dermabacter vaginalis]|uniref:hypothetical protein n=1 Tax=Dermabacter vaginalis TaxID=1630135 RepID=UPI001EF5E60B|nr:hypothetical protein [Dermabacter vaginalis]MCG7442807.1 hypothetical protein [Dermabacter vaginalis]MCT2149813.1 hypothetical protein [Dermabacter vaginalis]
MTGTETQPSGRRHGRRARAVSSDEQNTSATRGVTGDLTLYARRTAVIPPVADEQLPELKHYTGKRAKRRADVSVMPGSDEGAQAAAASEVKVDEPPAESTGMAKAAQQDAPGESPDSLSDALPAASVGTKKGSWPGSLRAPEADAAEPATEPQAHIIGTEAEPGEAAQASAWTSVTEGSEVEDTSASEALAPKPADPTPEPGPVYETTDAGDLTDASEWLEVGDLPADQAPEPKPAARFDGAVLHKPSRTSGGVGMWVTWLIVAAIAITLVALLMTGVIGPGIVNALAPAPETIPFDLSGGLTS